jgi:hypothetical protein
MKSVNSVPILSSLRMCLIRRWCPRLTNTTASFVCMAVRGLAQCESGVWVILQFNFCNCFAKKMMFPPPPLAKTHSKKQRNLGDIGINTSPRLLVSDSQAFLSFNSPTLNSSSQANASARKAFQPLMDWRGQNCAISFVLLVVNRTLVESYPEPTRTSKP